MLNSGIRRLICFFLRIFRENPNPPALVKTKTYEAAKFLFSWEFFLFLLRSGDLCLSSSDLSLLLKDFVHGSWERFLTSLFVGLFEDRSLHRFNFSCRFGKYKYVLHLNFNRLAGLCLKMSWVSILSPHIYNYGLVFFVI